MIGLALRRYGPRVALALVVCDLVVGYFVGTRLVAWELARIQEAW